MRNTSNLAFIGQEQDNITPQVRAAYKTGVHFKAEPTRIETVTYGEESIPVLVFPLGKYKGIMLPHETGPGIFTGTEEEFLNLPENQKGKIRQRMIGLLSADFSLYVKVKKLEEDIAYLSRKEAQEEIASRTLKQLGIKDIEETEDKIVRATVMALETEGAICDIGGFEAFLPRQHIDYTNPKPSRVLEIGQTIRAKVLKVEDGRIILSHKALLPDPWDNLDYTEGSIIKAKILRPARNGNGYIVAFEPGVIGYAKNYIPSLIPEPFEFVPVKIDIINREARFIVGRIVN